MCQKKKINSNKKTKYIIFPLAKLHLHTATKMENVLYFCSYNKWEKENLQLKLLNHYWTMWSLVVFDLEYDLTRYKNATIFNVTFFEV